MGIGPPRCETCCHFTFLASSDHRGHCALAKRAKAPKGFVGGKYRSAVTGLLVITRVSVCDLHRLRPPE
jgi:hypothetical protein